MTSDHFTLPVIKHQFTSFHLSNTDNLLSISFTLRDINRQAKKKNRNEKRLRIQLLAGTNNSR